MSDEQLILHSINDGVMTIRLNRLDKRNALTNTMYSQLAAAFTHAHLSAEVNAVIVTGGEHFSAGNDLQDFYNQS